VGQQRRIGNGLLLAVILVPAIEIWGIIVVSDWIGGGAAFLLMLLTGLLGYYIMRKEGSRAWREAQRQMQAGQPPGPALLNGLCVLIGGVLMLLPGFVSDVAGLTLIFPPTRNLYRGLIIGWLEKRMRSGSTTLRRW
jgi:UPF0716 protein FxsA